MIKDVGGKFDDFQEKSQIFYSFNTNQRPPISNASVLPS